MNNETLLYAGGAIQLGILIASALVPGTLNWRKELGQLPRLSRQLIWVHGGYIVLIIAAMGLLSLFEASQLAEGDVLARSICAFVAVFWSARLIIQWALFDARPYLANRMLRLGYHGLTLAFACLTVIYGWLAIG
ncbi:MAG TPA: hypothetical protein VG826_11410 [Pirellulales bacterium]|nr:hypothetical protein [Pirellulales bacterium]